MVLGGVVLGGVVLGGVVLGAVLLGPAPEAGCWLEDFEELAFEELVFADFFEDCILQVFGDQTGLALKVLWKKIRKIKSDIWVAVAGDE